MNRKEFLTNSLTAGAVLTTGTLAVAAPGMHMAMPTAAGPVQSLNARSFGAVGDGVADDSAALQRAFAALKERGALLIPAGTYRVTKPLIVPPQRSAHIRGEGMGATRIVAASKMPTLLRLEAPFASSFFSHMSLDGAGLADIAVHMMGGSYSHLDSLDVMNPRDTGILCGDDRAFGVGGAVGVECMVLNCRITGMRQTKSSDPGSRLGLMIGGNWSDGHFSNLIIKGFTDVGMEVRAASSKLHMVHIYKLPANRYRIALRVSGSFVSVSQCQFDNPSEVAVEVTRDNCVISSCFFIWNKVVFGDGPVTPVVGVRVGTAERKASGVSMIGNLFNRGRTSNDPPEYLSAPITALQIVDGGAVQSAFNVTNTVKLPDSENATNQAGALQGPAPA